MLLTGGVLCIRAGRLLGVTAVLSWLAQAGMIVAGWDREGGAQVYGIPLGGTLLHLPFTLGGAFLSGLSLALCTASDCVVLPSRPRASR